MNSTHIPVIVSPAGHHFKVISSGPRHACSVDSYNTMHCWGDPDHYSHNQSIGLHFAISLSWATTCFVALESSVPKCETIKLAGESESNEKGEIALPGFDWDLDGTIDSQDVLPRNPALSAYCPIGYFGSHDCQPAPPGRYAMGRGSITSLECPRGTIQPDQGTDYCVNTPAGSYADMSGMANAWLCNAGTYSNVVGMTNDSCEVTPKGHYSQAGSPFPIPCPLGTFQPIEGQYSCIISLPGHYVPELASLSQFKCLEGSYQPNFGSSDCIISSPGYYADAAGLATQTPCPSGTFSNQIGATSADICEISPPGSYSGEGSAFPQYCGTGEFQPFNKSL